MSDLLVIAVIVFAPIVIAALAYLYLRDIDKAYVVGMFLTAGVAAVFAVVGVAAGSIAAAVTFSALTAATLYFGIHTLHTELSTASSLTGSSSTATGSTADVQISRSSEASTHDA